MTATLTPASAPAHGAERSDLNRPVWRAALIAGVAAATVTVAIAALATALDVSLETAPGEAIPVIGFGQLTLFFTVIGALIALGAPVDDQTIHEHQVPWDIRRRSPKRAK